MKTLFSLLLFLTLQPCFGQNQLFMTTSAGWSVNYNKMHTDKPLPKRSLLHSRFSGFSTAFGLEYKFNPHWAVHVQVKTAGIKMGIKTTAVVKYDTATSGYKTRYGGSSGSSTRYAPAHFQVGVTYYSSPIKETKFSWLLGGGAAYLVTKYKFPNELYEKGSDLGINAAPNNARNNMYGKSFDIEMLEEFNRNGVLLNVHTGIDFHFAPNHHFLLTLQHNEGLRRIKQFRSTYFNYVDFTPSGTYSEPFKAVVYSKGSYSALQLGYKYRLTGRKKS